MSFFNEKTVRGVTLAATGLVLAAGGVAVSGAAHATTCVPTADEHDAAVVAVNGQTVTGPVLAGGCWYGVYIGPGISATVDKASISGFYKAGVFVDGRGDAPASGTISASTVNGSGNTGTAAQNGVEFWGAHAFGVVRGNTIDGHSYTGSGWTATGLLMFDTNPNQIDASQNKYLNNQTNQANVNTSSCANKLAHFYGDAGLCGA